MQNRVDRKRPSAVLEDRLGIDHIVDIDSSALGSLQLSVTHGEIEKSLENDKRLGPRNHRFKPRLAQNLNLVTNSETAIYGYADQHSTSEAKLNKSSTQREIDMASSPSKNKLEAGTSSLIRPTSTGYEGDDIIHLKVFATNFACL